MSDVGRIVEAEDCTSGACYTRHIIERGSNIQFVSTERVTQSGARRIVRPTGPQGEHEVFWEPRMPKADVHFPRGFVLVHDPTGELLDRCDLYIVHRRQGGAKNAPPDVMEEAQSYFIDQYDRPLKISYGSVEIPEGPWAHLARARLIRYKRPGFKKPFEHEYDPPVDVRYSKRVLGYRLPLPYGCVVDDHGFRWP